MKRDDTSEGLAEFPLFEGGPHYRVMNAIGFRAPDWKNAPLLALLAAALAWIPLAALSAAQGLFARGSIDHAFSGDVALHLKLLLALPAFVLSDRVVRRPLLALLRRFLDHDLVAPDHRGRFTGCVASAVRLRDARASSFLILLLAGCCSFILYRTVLSGIANNWHFTEVGGARALSWAGWWHALVSYPLYLFIIFRFFFRLMLWWRLLAQISRMPLRLQPAHPDGAGGLLFLGASLPAFMLPAFALSTALSSSTAALMLATGASLLAHKNGVIAIAALVAVLFAAPLFFFVLPLGRARKRALMNYDAQASVRLATLDGTSPNNPDMSEVSDINAVGAAIRSMRPLPFERADLILLLVAILLPFIAVMSTAIPVVDMLKKLLGLFA